MPQRVALTGASGVIGGALSAFLTARGDHVVHLVRQPPRSAAEIEWHPESRRLEPRALEGVDAVVHLAAASPGDRRWTSSYKKQILASRVDGTSTIATALAELGEDVRLVSQSAVGYYGDRGEEILTEDSPPGTGFPSEVVRAWEEAADPARDAGLSVAHSRTGVVLGPGTAAMERMLPLARLGVNGRLGSGRQWWAWISLHDTVAGLAFLVDHPELQGPVNLVAPAVRQVEVAKELGRQLHRPAVLPAPAFGVRLVVGGFADEVLTSKRVVPARLTDAGFVPALPDIESALSEVLRDRSDP